jgi:Basic region leucine zipper
MSNPFGIPLGGQGHHDAQNTNIYPIGTDFGPFFDDFVPIASPTPDEERLAAAIDEDKRRRNTAASARFRVKKKEREQAMERTAAEMTEKVDRLQNRVRQLELENGWLKDLITEKTTKRKNKEKREARREKSKAKSIEEGESDEEARSPGEHTDGVGTDY